MAKPTKKQEEKLQARKTVEVHILRGGTPHGEPGSVVMVTPEEAEGLCQLRMKDLGNGKTEPYRVAKPVNEKDSPIDLANLTIEEARALGIKNIASAPKNDPIASASVQVNDEADPVNLDDPQVQASASA